MSTIETSKYPRPDATYLQGIAAYVTGTPAGDLKPGDTIIWNGGGESVVVAILKETPKFITISERGETGHVYEGRRLKKTRIVARPMRELDNQESN